MKKLATIDLTYENQLIKAEFLRAFEELYDSNLLMIGPALDELEVRLAQFCGTRHAALTGSGTMALQVAAKALVIGPGDEVVVPANTFLASAVAFYHAGAKVLLADVDPQTLNLTPETVERAITPRTKAICLVHLYGGIVDPEPFRRFGVALIEDASHAFGGDVRGKKVGHLADVAAFSAGPIKAFGAMGHAGFITYDQGNLKGYIDAFINNGQTSRHFATMVGHNFRMDTAVALHLLKKLGQWPHLAQRRREVATIYHAYLSEHDIPFQRQLPGAHPVLWVYVIRVDAAIRDGVLADLKEVGVDCLVQYTHTINQMPIWPEMSAAPAHVPVSEQLCRQIISLPVHPGITPEDAEYVCSHVVRAVRRRGR
jgi:dTDP-4-amino-4,6-dideoxygalactose transaminase